MLATSVGNLSQESNEGRWKPKWVASIARMSRVTLLHCVRKCSMPHYWTQFSPSSNFPTQFLPYLWICFLLTDKYTAVHLADHYKLANPSLQIKYSYAENFLGKVPNFYGSEIIIELIKVMWRTVDGFGGAFVLFSFILINLFSKCESTGLVPHIYCGGDSCYDGSLFLLLNIGLTEFLYEFDVSVHNDLSIIIKRQFK